MRRALLMIAVLVAPLLACNDGSTTGPTQDAIVIEGTIRGTGVVTYSPVEGGVWAIRSGDVTYEPLGTLPAQFRREGLRVEFEGQIRDDVGSIYMIGPIIELTRIRAL